jgi:hypothetical protein
MKKIPKSISRIIVEDENGDLALKYDRRESKFLFHNREFFKGKVPRRPYTVTYTVNPRWVYLVEGDLLFRDQYSTVCFLPRSWHGLRVSRRVTPIGKKQVKDKGWEESHDPQSYGSCITYARQPATIRDIPPKGWAKVRWFTDRVFFREVTL